MGLRNKFVYIIDDDRSVLKALERLFRVAGYVPECFSSGAEFLRKRDLEENTVVVCDLSMPHLNGVEVLGRLTSRSICLPFVFLTANDEVSKTEQVHLTGITCLRKPVDADVLLEAVSDAQKRGNR